MTSSSADDLKFTWWDMIKSLFFLLDKKRVSYSVYSIILISVLFYDLVPIWIVGKIIDFLTNYTPGNSLLSFYKYVAFFTISWGMSSFIRLSVKRKLTNIQYDTTYFTRVTGFERLMDFSIKWHDSENSGNKVQRIQSGTDALRQLQRVLSKDVFRNMTAVIGVLTAFLFLKPMFVLYSLVYIALFITVQMSFYKRLVEINRANNILNEKASGTYFEGLNNILTIKTLGVKDDFKKNINSREELTRDSSKKKSALVNNKWKMFQTINALAIGGILFFSGMSFLGGAITLGSIFIIYSYFQKLNGAVTEFMEIVEDLITTKISIARMMPIFKNESSAHRGDQPFPSDWESIAIENASFMYQHKSQDEGEKDTLAIGLDALNLKIKRHDKVGVVGESGSGKSTFAKMMLGLYEFTAGKFKIGNTSFYEIRHDEITRNIALVLQDSEMFNLSLKENITLMRNYDETLFNKAILISQLESVIKKLPAGVDTLIGEKGYRLSGGERQRIGIARAIYKDPQILILDEATSSLDSKTESLIQKAFEEHLTQKTIVSIAHRITTLKNVDKILVFEKGKIIEEGTFKELSKNPSSHFYHISHLQQKKGVGEAQLVI